MAVLGIAALLLGAAAVCMPLYMRWQVRKKLPPDVARQLPDLLYNPAELPPEWREAKPFSPQLTEAYNRQFEEWVKFTKNPILTGPALGSFNFSACLGEGFRSRNEEYWTSAALYLQPAEAWLAQITSIVHLHDYNCEIFAPPPGLRRKAEGFPQVRDGAWLLCLRAHLLIRNGDLERALSDIQAIFRLGKRHPASNWENLNNSFAAQDAAMLAMTLAAGECTSTQHLRFALDELNRLSPSFDASFTSHIVLLDAVGSLRAMAREGYPVDFSVRKPPVYWTARMCDACLDFPKRKLSQLAPDDPRRELLESFLANSPSLKKASGYDFPWEEGMFRISCSLAPEKFHMVWPKANTVSPSPQKRQAAFDLLRLRIAGRLMQGKAKATSSTLESYVPEYLPEVPLDPHTGQPYKWNPVEGQFFSL